MTTEILKQILSEKTINFTVDEAVFLVEQELSKPQNLQDAELLQDCLDLLSGFVCGGEKVDKKLRDELFPNGKPEPEEFIAVIADYIKKSMEKESDNEE